MGDARSHAHNDNPDGRKVFLLGEVGVAVLQLFHGYPDFDWIRSVHDAFRDEDGPSFPAAGQARFEGPDGGVVILVGTFGTNFSAGIVTGFTVYENETEEGNDNPTAQVLAGLSIDVTGTLLRMH